MFSFMVIFVALILTSMISVWSGMCADDESKIEELN